MADGISCRACGIYKEIGSYHKGQRTCKECRSDYNYRPEVQKKNRDSKLRSAYGIDSETYDEMRSQQFGCYICKRVVSGEYLHVDHCHKTGEVRKLLCAACNKGLGHFKDDANLLLTASNYIREHKK